MTVNSSGWAWRKSSRSSQSSDCVEIGSNSGGGGIAAVRDSKNPDGPILTCDVQAFIRTLAARQAS